MTIKQKQLLLAYLGYYVGALDSKWGSGSREACKAFQRDFGITADGICGAETEKALKHAIAYGMPSKTVEKPKSEDFWGSIKYFREEEFACKCGCGASGMEEKLIKAADKVRAHFGNRITVSSGRRCTTHNARVGGVSNSRHLSGKAMDFCVSGMSSDLVLTYVQKLPEIRYAYAIDSGFVHMDID